MAIDASYLWCQSRVDVPPPVPYFWHQKANLIPAPLTVGFPFDASYIWCQTRRVIVVPVAEIFLFHVYYKTVWYACIWCISRTPDFSKNFSRKKSVAYTPDFTECFFDDAASTKHWDPDHRELGLVPQLSALWCTPSRPGHRNQQLAHSQPQAKYSFPNYSRWHVSVPTIPR